MTDALVPDTALVQHDEFQRRLPEGWYVRAYDARIEFSDRIIGQERILYVELWHHLGARVDLCMKTEPDWEWLLAYLGLVASVPVGIRVDADRREMGLW